MTSLAARRAQVAAFRLVKATPGGGAPIYDGIRAKFVECPAKHVPGNTIVTHVTHLDGQA